MEKLLEELKTVIPLKPDTGTGDIVLIVGENPQMIIYGIVTSIDRDPSKKDEWWNIGLTFLTVPLQKVVWTLRTEQMTGKEIFTMGGEKRFFQAVDLEMTPLRTPSNEKGTNAKKKSPLKRVK
jgi:hypothetical protein